MSLQQTHPYFSNHLSLGHCGVVATMASQELARGSSHKGRDADEGLREESGDGEKEDEDENSWLLYLHVRGVDLRLVTSSILWELIR